MRPETGEQWYVARSATFWFFGCLLLLFISGAAIFGVKWVTADARGAGDAREQIKANGSFRIAAYNEFFDLCSSVQAQEDRIRIFSDDPSPEGQINLRAVEAKRADLIREYNSKASREYTEGQFRDSDLPFQLSVNNKETQCAI